MENDQIGKDAVDNYNHNQVFVGLEIERPESSKRTLAFSKKWFFILACILLSLILLLVYTLDTTTQTSSNLTAKGVECYNIRQMISYKCHLTIIK